MNPSLSAVRGTRGHLIRQLVYFDEQYTQFYDSYLFGYPEAERILLERTIRSYTESLTQLLANDDTQLTELLRSTVLIGSRVAVRYEEDGYEEAFTIVFPTESDPDSNRISFLSPIGRQLLGTKPQGKLALSVPDGTMNVSVLRVSYAFLGGFDAE